jgi:hypothetical protein
MATELQLKDKVRKSFWKRLWKTLIPQDMSSLQILIPEIQVEPILVPIYGTMELRPQKN